MSATHRPLACPTANLTNACILLCTVVGWISPQITRASDATGRGVHFESDSKQGLKLSDSTIFALHHGGIAIPDVSGLNKTPGSVILAAAVGDDDEPAKIPASAKPLPLSSSSRKAKHLPPKPKAPSPKSAAPKSGDSEEPEANAGDTAEAGESEAFRKILEGQFQNDASAAKNALRPNTGATLSFSDDGGMELSPPDLEAAAPIPDEVKSKDPKPVKKKSEDDGKSKECPGFPGGEYYEDGPQPGDIHVEQDDHPYDAAPAARADEPKTAESDLGPAPRQAFTSRQLALRDSINRCLNHYMAYPENVVKRGPWALMHASLPFGVEAEIIAGKRRVNALGWMCHNGVCAKQRMFQATRSGFRPNLGPGVQGHEGQFLAILAQSQVQSDYPIKIGRRSYTIKDLVRHEQQTCREKSELTFKLLGLSYYLPQEATWRDNRGRPWSLEKLVGEELAQPINGAACGGTHRLMALSFAVIEHQKAGLPITGYWAKAEKYLNDYVNYAMSLQNPDGSFSTEWFESRGRSQDIERKVQTTGHILEWLIYTLPEEHLLSPRIEQSVEFLVSTVGKNLDRDWPIGPRGHALRALVLYNQRVFGAEPGKVKSFIAETTRSQSYR